MLHKRINSYSGPAYERNNGEWHAAQDFMRLGFTCMFGERRGKLHRKLVVMLREVHSSQRPFLVATLRTSRSILNYGRACAPRDLWLLACEYSAAIQDDLDIFLRAGLAARVAEALSHSSVYFLSVRYLEQKVNMARVTRKLGKAARIILIGAPGVGKGTQTERLISRYPQLASLSSGDMLRDHVRNKTAVGMSIH